MWSQEQPEEVLLCPAHAQDGVRCSLQVAYRDVVKDERHWIPSPIALRREVGPNAVLVSGPDGLDWSTGLATGRVNS